MPGLFRSLRQRKDRPGIQGYSSYMEDVSFPHPDHTVSQVLNRWPQAAHVFIRLKTDCVGCVLARFCSLREVVEIYHLEMAGLLLEINQSIPASLPSPIEGESNKSS